LTTPNPYLVHTPVPASPRPAKAPKSQVSIDRKAERRRKREARQQALGALSNRQIDMILEDRASRALGFKTKLVIDE
jgi:hypothetical protein